MPLNPTSATAAAARRYSNHLRRIMRERGIGERHLAKQLGVSVGTLSHLRQARNVPGLALGYALADALDSDFLRELIIDIRTQQCARPSCPVTFVNPGQHRLYCCDYCRRVMEKVVRDEAKGRPGDRLKSVEHSLGIAQAEIDQAKAAVMDMCRGCEPEGVCRTASCPLRPISPLPLLHVPEVGIVQRYTGLNDADRERVREIHAAANRRRFYTPEARAHMSALTTAQRARQRAAREAAAGAEQVAS